MREQRAASSWVVFVCAVAWSSIGCSDDTAVAGTSNAGATAGGAMNQAGAAPNVSGGSAGAAQTGTPLTWDAGGFVAPDANPFGIQGPFYFYSDCDPPSGLPCTMPDASLTGPDTKPGWSVDASGACIKGTAVKVQENMFSAQWGAGLALDLNSKGGDPGAPASKGTLNATDAKIRGFSVDIAGTAPAKIRINLTMPGVPDSSFVDAMVPGTTTFDIADAKQGSWVKTKTPLDPTQLEALQFQVFTNASMPVPFDFCVKAIRVIPAVAP